MARALTFGVLVLCNLALIHVNRFWTRASWQRGGPVNVAFGWIALATVVLLGIVLWIPAVGRLFAFVLPTPALLAAGLGAVAAGSAVVRGGQVAALPGRRHRG